MGDEEVAHPLVVIWVVVRARMGGFERCHVVIIIPIQNMAGMETRPTVFGVMEGGADGRRKRGGIVGVRVCGFFSAR